MHAEFPWEEEAVFTRKLMHEFDKKAAFHKVDIFHTVSLGVGKAWAACGFAILQQVCPGTSIEKRLQVLSDLYVEYCVDPQPLIDAIFVGLCVFFFQWVNSIQTESLLPYC